MPVAPTYNRQFNFTNYQAVNPATPLPATPLDSELSSVKVTLDALNANLNLIQRSDGQLANASVGPQQLQPSILTGISPPTQWSSASVSYQVGATVFSGLLFYVCNTANVSSAGNPPATFGAWTLLADFSGVTIPVGSITSAAFAPGAVNSAALGANLALPGSPTTGDNSTAIATTAFVDAQVGAMLTGYKNRLINGAMAVDQRNSGASGTAVKYTVDGWNFNASLATKGTWQQNRGAVTPPVGFQNYLGFTSNSAYSVVIGDHFAFQQSVEAANLYDLGFGTANAQPLTLSFWVYSSLTGTFGGSVANYASTRSYPFTYSIPVANTWTQIEITIPGDTGGTWVLSGAGGGLYVSIGLGAGATFSGTAGSWQSGAFFSATGAVSVVGTSGATLYLTGVSLGVGIGAGPAPFEFRHYGAELVLCQRYYEPQFQDLISCNVTSGSNYEKYTPFAVPKRAAPTIVLGTVTATIMGTPSNVGNSLTGVRWLSTASGTGAGFIEVNWTADASL